MEKELTSNYFQKLFIDKPELCTDLQVLVKKIRELQLENKISDLNHKKAVMVQISYGDNLVFRVRFKSNEFAPRSRLLNEQASIEKAKAMLCRDEVVQFTQANVINYFGNPYQLTELSIPVKKLFTQEHIISRRFSSSTKLLQNLSQFSENNPGDIDLINYSNQSMAVRNKEDLVPKDEYLPLSIKLSLAELNLRTRGTKLDSVEFAILYRIFKPIRTLLLTNNYIMENIKGLEPRILLEIVDRAKNSFELSAILEKTKCKRHEPLNTKQQLKVYRTLLKQKVLFPNIRKLVQRLQQKMMKQKKLLSEKIKTQNYKEETMYEKKESKEERVTSRKHSKS